MLSLSLPVYQVRGLDRLCIAFDSTQPLSCLGSFVVEHLPSKGCLGSFVVELLPSKQCVMDLNPTRAALFLFYEIELFRLVVLPCLLTLSAHVPKGYGSCPVCVSVCVCVCVCVSVRKPDLGIGASRHLNEGTSELSNAFYTKIKQHFL